MNILFIHYDLPAQFAGLIKYLASSKKNSVYGICQDKAPIINHSDYNTVSIYTYTPAEIKNKTHDYLSDFDKAIKRAQQVLLILQQCKKRKIVFDIAIAHSGWGELLYFKEAYPQIPLIGYVEYFYRPAGADAGFDPKYPVSIDTALLIKTLNAQLLLAMTECDALVTPTCWQKNLFPEVWKNQIRVLHEGVDTDKVHAVSEISFTLPDGTELTKNNEVITYTARNLEPYRGFQVFIRVIEKICRMRPSCHIIICGGDDISYSRKLADGKCYREELLKEVEIPKDRVHFLGTVSYRTFLQILQLSTVHIYLTYPFVLSWSLLEAMASECIIVASTTPPVTEFIEHTKNGLLANFFDYKEFALHINKVLDNPDKYRYLAQNARKLITKSFRQSQSVQHYQFLIKHLIEQHHA